MKPYEDVDMAVVVDIAKRAGEAIMSIYEKTYRIDLKEDRSPLTDADRAAHRIIIEGLASSGLPRWPVLSEEGESITWETRRAWTTFWLVDPLDGTKEFIRKNGEFTVNIALIHEGVPVLGVVYAPALQTLYYGAEGEGAVRVDTAGSRPLPLPQARDTFVVVASRSHSAKSRDRPSHSW